jgi:hypothetical protein
MDLTPISGIRKGSFTSTGFARTLDLVFVPDIFRMVNFTQASFAGPGSRTKKVEWFNGFPLDQALGVQNTAGLATDESFLITSGGVSPFDQSVPSVFPAVAVTSVSLAAQALVTTAAPHGLISGDIVELYGVTVMTQLNGLYFSVTVTGANTFTINVDTTNIVSFPLAGAGGFMRKQFPPQPWQPYRNVITGISQALPGVVQTAMPHGYSSGDFVRINIPAVFGMSQLSGQQVQVLVLSPTSFALGQNQQAFTALDTTAYSPFAWPAPVQYPFTFAQSVPIGEVALSLLNPKRNTAIRGLLLGANVVGLAGDVWYWEAIKATV